MCRIHICFGKSLLENFLRTWRKNLRYLPSLPEDEVISVAAVDKVRVVVVADEMPSSEFSLPLKAVVLLLGLTLWRPLRGLLLLCLDLVLFRPPPEETASTSSFVSSALSSFLDFRDLLLVGLAFSGLGDGLGSSGSPRSHEPPSSSSVSALSPAIWWKNSEFRNQKNNIILLLFFL